MKIILDLDTMTRWREVYDFAEAHQMTVDEAIVQMVNFALSYGIAYDEVSGRYEPDSDSLRDRLRNTLRDENGLQPTEAATDVLMMTVKEIEATDEKWEGAKTPPRSVYALNITRRFIDKLRGVENE